MLPRPGWYTSYWAPSPVITTVIDLMDLHATLPITKIFPPTLKRCRNCCKDVDCNFPSVDNHMWLCDCKYCINCNLIYTECTCLPNLLLTRKLLGIDDNGQEILESDADFRQRIKAMYDSNK